MGIRRSSQGCVSVLNRITDNTLLAGARQHLSKGQAKSFQRHLSRRPFQANKCVFESAALGYLSEPELSPSS